MSVRFLLSSYLLCILATGPVLAAETAGLSKEDADVITVYRDPNCNCCYRWIEHLRRNGYTVEDHKTDRLSFIKQNLNVPARLASCHTATVDGYIIEGHVPAMDIRRLLTEKPDIRGISVPGMPIGSPGMEMGNQRDSYSVIEFDEAQQMSVFQHYPAK